MHKYFATVILLLCNFLFLLALCLMVYGVLRGSSRETIHVSLSQGGILDVAIRITN